MEASEEPEESQCSSTSWVFRGVKAGAPHFSFRGPRHAPRLRRGDLQVRHCPDPDLGREEEV